MRGVLNIATQIAAGLQAAHEKGVVHRDIKSSNIMITNKGQVKIMDFGLAKIKGGPQMTRAGSTVGTPYYMSPEQAGGKPVDARTDIWAFGVVLYEMLTGELPFKEEYEQAVIYSILNEEPKPVSSLRPDVPEFLEQIIEKALAKNPQERFPEAANLFHELKGEESRKTDSFRVQETNRMAKSNSGISRAMLISFLAILLLSIVAVVFLKVFSTSRTGGKSPVKRIAVLPLENLGPANQEYFADGITGEITSKLSGLSGLEVIARSSAMQYKNTTRNLREIGKELNVDYVLQGTIQWGENSLGKKRIRVNPELIKIAGATQVWSQPYEADFSDAFQLQADIAARVAEGLNLTLLKTEQQALQSKPTANSEAYDTYLRASEYSNFDTDEKKLRIAEQMFLKAVALDGNFAAAYAGLSTVQSDLHWFYFERSEQNLASARRNAEKALALNPNLPEAHVAMGNYYYHGKLEYEPALREYNVAIKLQPNNADAFSGIGFVLRRQGKMQEALVSLKRALELDPRNFQAAVQTALTFSLLGEYGQAVKTFDRAISLTPDDPFAYGYKALSYLLKDADAYTAHGIIESALQRKIGVSAPFLRYLLTWCDVIEGKYPEALKHLSGISKMDDQFYYLPVSIIRAQVYGLMKNAAAKENYQAARQLLEQGIKQYPQDSRRYSSLGLAYAGLGMKAEAIREGKRGLELLPMSKEAWRGSFRVLDLARIYTMVGKPDLALNLLDELLGSPTDAISVALLKVDPTWAPLRQHPRYQQLLKKYSPGETI